MDHFSVSFVYFKFNLFILWLILYEFLDILLGVGIAFTIKCIKSGHGYMVIKFKNLFCFNLKLNNFYSLKIQKSLLQDVLALFLGISLISSLIFIPLNKFYFSRKYGIYLIFVYNLIISYTHTYN